MKSLGEEMATRSQQVSVDEQLQSEKRRLQERISDIDRAQELLKKNPDISELMDLLRKHSF